MKKRMVALIIGNIGAGKTTLARKLSDAGFLIIDQDSMREMLGCGKYHYSLETEPIIKKISSEFIAELSARNIDFAVDGCLVSKELRKSVIEIIRSESEKSGIKTVIAVHVLPRLDKKESLKRRMSNPRGISKKVWSQVWDKFDKKFEFPTVHEDIDIIVENEYLRS